jgi:hypothetical protein
METTAVIEVGNEFYWYHLRCEVCKNTTIHPGPRRDSMDWQGFVFLLKKSPEAGHHFKFCGECNKMTRTVLIAFDAE